MASVEKRESGSGTTYRVKVRLKGYPTQTATFKRLTDAKKWAHQTESAIQEGRYFKTNEAKKHTFNELADRYIKHVLPLKPKSIVDQTRHLEWWKSEIGSYLLCDITSILLSEKKEKLLSDITTRKTKRSPSTVNRYLAALSHCFTIAKKEWGWITENPVANITRYKERKGVVRYLSDEERKKLLPECKNSKTKALYPIVIIALSTGARLGEITNLKWSDISFERSVITLYETKNKEIRLIPLVSLAKESLLEWQKISRKGTLVFPSNHDNTKSINIRASWTRALSQAEIEDFRFHDLRHSAASYLAMNGASLAEIAEVLGHKTLQMVKRYAHLSEAHTASVVAKMNEKIFG